jgi:CubicO group peptidase (beta-lactamase class C family)
LARLGETAYGPAKAASAGPQGRDNLKLTAPGWLAAASVAVLALVVPACSSSAPGAPSAAARPYNNPAWPQAETADPTAVGFSREGLAALDARIAKSVADQDVAGAVTLLVRHGQVIQYRTYGQATPSTPMAKDSLFRIYSMSKPITGVAMMQLYEQGKWKLDDPITKFAPELANLRELTWGADGKAVLGADGRPVLRAPARPATMRELMSHTAGFGYGLSGDDPVNTAFRNDAVLASPNLDVMMQRIANIPLLYEPGSRWSYSVAVDIQGYLVQKLSGQKFGDYLKQHVTGPLGMTETAFFVTEQQRPRFTDVYSWDRTANRITANPDRPDRPGYFDRNRLESGGGGLVASTHDYARFCQMFLNRGELAGHRLLRPETVELMRTNHIGALRLYSDGTNANPGLPGVGFGLDFAVYGPTSATSQPYGAGTHYWGGAAGTWFWIDPVNDLFFIGMIQRMGAARPGGMDFRGESARLVYGALTDPSK